MEKPVAKEKEANKKDEVVTVEQPIPNNNLRKLMAQRRQMRRARAWAEFNKSDKELFPEKEWGQIPKTREVIGVFEFSASEDENDDVCHPKKNGLLDYNQNNCCPTCDKIKSDEEKAAMPEEEEDNTPKTIDDFRGINGMVNQEEFLKYLRKFVLPPDSSIQ